MKTNPDVSADVHVRDLTRRFGSRTVLDSLNLTVSPGERIALVGPNGSGKTTLLRCIAGTLEIDAGEISILGHPAGSFEARQQIGVSFSQERSLHLRLTGVQNLYFFARMRGFNAQEGRAEVARVIGELELEEFAGIPVGLCSTGMIQQLSLARTLLGNPPLILLDEPTRSLDENARERLWGILRRNEEAALMIATHLKSDLQECSRRLDFPL